MRRLVACAFLCTLGLTAGGVQAAPARCDLMSDDPVTLRQDLVHGKRTSASRMVLRFLQFTDDHIIDDDGQAVIGASVIDPLHPQFESAMRLQEEYSDEVLNNMIGHVNECNAAFPSEFMMVTGDSADQTTIGETRRFIDNLDGTFDEMSAFEVACRAALPAGTKESVYKSRCTRFTGRGVADTQSPDPDPEALLYQPLLTRTLLQLLATENAATTGRAADGSLDFRRQTATRAPGLPEVLRCKAGKAGCPNERIAMPWYIAFGNHDGYLRGTLPIDVPANVVAQTFGRHYMLRQNEFVREFFNTQPDPGPVGHGFNFVEPSRLYDDNDRNDGYYAFDAARGKMRMIVLNTLVDGVDARIPTEALRNPFALSDGSLDAPQFEWLKKQLAKAYRRGQLVIAFSHHPDVSFAEYGTFAALVPIDVTAVQLDGLLASYPNVIAWVAGHTHRHRIRPFKVEGETGSNGTISAPVSCKRANACKGFWQIETASLIDYPQEQRLIEVYDNGNGTGTIRGPVLTHTYEKVRPLAAADDRCALYLLDPASLEVILTEADLSALCSGGGTRQGDPNDRNVELTFKMPVFPTQ